MYYLLGGYDFRVKSAFICLFIYLSIYYTQEHNYSEVLYMYTQKKLTGKLCTEWHLTTAHLTHPCPLFHKWNTRFDGKSQNNSLYNCQCICSV